MPQVIETNDAGLLGLLAGNAGNYATNRDNYDLALQQWQATQNAQRANVQQALDLVAMNQANDYRQQQLALDQQRQQALLNQQAFGNQMALANQDFTQNIAPRQELDRALALQNNAAALRQKEQQTTLDENQQAAASIVGTLPAEQQSAFAALVQAGARPLDALAKLSAMQNQQQGQDLAKQRLGLQQTYQSAQIQNMAADNARADQAQQAKLEKASNYLDPQEKQLFAQASAIVRAGSAKTATPQQVAAVPHAASVMQDLFDRSEQRYQQQALRMPATQPSAVPAPSTQPSAAPTTTQPERAIPDPDYVVAGKYPVYVDPQKLAAIPVGVVFYTLDQYGRLRKAVKE